MVQVEGVERQIIDLTEADVELLDVRIVVEDLRHLELTDKVQERLRNLSNEIEDAMWWIKQAKTNLLTGQGDDT